MNTNSEFSCDNEFLKIMTRSADVNLTAAALELARDAYPALDFEDVFHWIQSRADELSRAIAQARTETDALEELGKCLSGKYGIRGDRESYELADSSYLNRIIATQRGIPISLSLLYMAVGEQAGVPLLGVSAPGHFLTRYESVGGPLFLDAFRDGQILTYDECCERMQLENGLTREHAESALEPAGARTIIIRMLNNLKALHARQNQWGAAWVVQHRLTSLHPTSYVERRDMALISLKADRPGLAIDLLEACLKRCPCEDTQLLEQHLGEAKRQLSRWN